MPPIRAAFRALLPLVVLPLLLFTALPAAGAEKLPIVVDHLGDRVIRVRTEGGASSQLAVATDRGIVVFNSLWSPAAAREYREVIRETFGRDDFHTLVYTGHDVIGTGGDAAYPGIRIIAHEKTRDAFLQRTRNPAPDVDRRIAVMRRKAERSRNMLPDLEPGTEEEILHRRWMIWCDRLADELEEGYAVTLPSLTFRDRMTLEMGDCSIRLIDFGAAYGEYSVIVEIPEEEILTLPFNALHLAPIPGRGIAPDVPRWTAVLEELLDGGGAERTRILCHGWDGPVPREEIEQRRRYIRDLWEGIEKAAAEGLDYETALRRLSIDGPFAYVKQWELWEGHGRDWVIDDHEGRMFPAFWRALHEDGAEAIAAALDRSETRGAGNALASIRENARNRYYFLEGTLNELGYRLLGENRVDEAIAVLRINVEKFPESWNAHDSFAEACLKGGDRESAIRHYRESLAMNPENENGREMLRRLGAE